MGQVRLLFKLNTFYSADVNLVVPKSDHDKKVIGLT